FWASLTPDVFNPNADATRDLRILSRHRGRGQDATEDTRAFGALGGTGVVAANRLDTLCGCRLAPNRGTARHDRTQQRHPQRADRLLQRTGTGVRRVVSPARSVRPGQ